MEGLLKRKNLEPTKDESAIQKQFILNGMRILHGPESRDQFLQILSEGEPADAVADVAMRILEKLEQSAEREGAPLDDMTKIVAGQKFIDEVIETGERTGALKKMNEEERVLAFSNVLAQVLDRDIKSGKINPQELLKAGQEAQQRMGMDGQDEKLQALGLQGVL